MKYKIITFALVALVLSGCTQAPSKSVSKPSPATQRSVKRVKIKAGRYANDTQQIWLKSNHTFVEAIIDQDNNTRTTISGHYRLNSNQSRAKLIDEHRVTATFADNDALKADLAPLSVSPTTESKTEVLKVSNESYKLLGQSMQRTQAKISTLQAFQQRQNAHYQSTYGIFSNKQFVTTDAKFGRGRLEFKANHFFWEIHPVTGDDTQAAAFAEGTFSFDPKSAQLTMSIADQSKLYQNVSASGTEQQYSSTAVSPFPETPTMQLQDHQGDYKLGCMKPSVGAYSLDSKPAPETLTSVQAVEKTFIQVKTKSLNEILPSVDKFQNFIENEIDGTIQENMPTKWQQQTNQTITVSDDDGTNRRSVQAVYLVSFYNSFAHDSAAYAVDATGKIWNEEPVPPYHQVPRLTEDLQSLMKGTASN